MSMNNGSSRDPEVSPLVGRWAYNIMKMLFSNPVLLLECANVVTLFAARAIASGRTAIEMGCSRSSERRTWSVAFICVFFSL
ncbi:hypothetical protein L210DRAFT_938444 [Boletus edulis BED1]|uniref:Uncharacterized protein n=1 Tax=Boletus edulis BED1 TaxID=1328754 RepID=A0AAD4GGI7_BOLED|nr:hypothetical protein L210DRAFT_938444 [Boletus edulis BED1]